MSPVEEDPRVDKLYDVPLSAFVAERNQLAKQLRAEGDKDGSSTVRALQKPSVAAWVVNQIARRDADRLERIIAVGAALRDAQREALTGGRPEVVRRALAEERAVVTDAVEAARSIIEETGTAPSPALLDRIAGTLYALASNDIAREQVRHGRLTHEVQRVGFGDFEVPESALVGRTPPDRADDRATKERDALEAKIERAEERATRLRREADEARERADQAEQVARDAARELTALRERSEQA